MGGRPRRGDGGKGEAGARVRQGAQRGVTAGKQECVERLESKFIKWGSRERGRGVHGVRSGNGRLGDYMAE